MPTTFDLNDLVRAKLPFWATVKRAYGLTFENFGALVTLSWKWFLLVLPFQLLFFWNAFPAISATYAQLGKPEMQPLPFWVLAGMLVVGLLVYVVFSAPAVGWHRLILRGERPSGVMQVDNAMLHYAGIVLVLYGLTNLVSLMQAAFTPAPNTAPELWQILGLMASMVAMYAGLILLFRFLVFLPGVAVGNPNASLSTVWRATRGHTFRLLFGNLLAALPFTLVTIAATYGLFAYADRLTAMLLLPLSTAIGYVGVAASLAFTSLAYRFLYEREG